MKDLLNTIHNCDCIPFMKALPDEAVTLIVADPPYGLAFGKGPDTYNRDDSLVLDGYIDVPSQQYLQFSRMWIKEAARILKEDGTCYIVSGHTHLEYIMTAAREADLLLKDMVIWQYPFGVYTSKKYVVSHYSILCYCKNLKKVKFYGNARKQDSKESYHDRVDVWQINRENWSGHLRTPNNLPKDLLQKLIEYSSIPGDLIFDPFLGSSNTAVVAKQLKRNYLGCELCKNYFDFGSKRLSTGQYLLKEL